MQTLRATLAAAVERLRAAVEPGAAEREARFAEAEEAVRRAERARRLRDAGATLPEPMRAAIVAGRVPTRTHSGRAVVSWWSNPRETLLVLGGRTGCGKTTAASWAIAQHDRGGRLRPASVIAQLWRSGSYSAERARDELSSCGLLVVDDVGAEHQQQREWTAVALRDLIEVRLGEGLRTVLTTNLARAELERAYNDPRLTSRLLRARWVVDTGDDLRSKRS